MSKLPAWRIDPAWPAAPDCAEDDDDPPAVVLYAPRQPDLFEAERAVMARRVAELHVQGTRLLLRLHHAQRELQRSRAPAHRGGHPGHRARNDRLLALFEATPAYLPHLQRCRRAAQALANEQAASAGLPLEHARVMPATTARDAIAEALRHRAEAGPDSRP